MVRETEHLARVADTREWGKAAQMTIGRRRRGHLVNWHKRSVNTRRLASKVEQRGDALCVVYVRRRGGGKTAARATQIKQRDQPTISTHCIFTFHCAFLRSHPLLLFLFLKKKQFWTSEYEVAQLWEKRIVRTNTPKSGLSTSPISSAQTVDRERTWSHTRRQHHHNNDRAAPRLN